MTGPRSIPPAKMTEAEWQQQVIDLAHALGWNHLHVRRTIGKGNKWVTSTNRKGWPDLLLWHPTRGFAAVELKVGKNQPSPEQVAVLAELEAAGARTMVAYPDDLQRLAAMLSHNERGKTVETRKQAEERAAAHSNVTRRVAQRVVDGFAAVGIEPEYAECLNDGTVKVTFGRHALEAWLRGQNR